jgi:hypothetical protein
VFLEFILSKKAENSSLIFCFMKRKGSGKKNKLQNTTEFIFFDKGFVILLFINAGSCLTKFENIEV